MKWSRAHAGDLKVELPPRGLSVAEDDMKPNLVLRWLVSLEWEKPTGLKVSFDGIKKVLREQRREELDKQWADSESQGYLWSKPENREPIVRMAKFLRKHRHWMELELMVKVWTNMTAYDASLPRPADEEFDIQRWDMRTKAKDICTTWKYMYMPVKALEELELSKEQWLEVRSYLWQQVLLDAADDDDAWWSLLAGLWKSKWIWPHWLVSLPKRAPEKIQLLKLHFWSNVARELYVI